MRMLLRVYREEEIITCKKEPEEACKKNYLKCESCSRVVESVVENDLPDYL